MRQFIWRRKIPAVVLVLILMLTMLPTADLAADGDVVTDGYIFAAATGMLTALTKYRLAAGAGRRG